jgi:ATP-binding cassette, subfamily B, bacterial
MTVTTDNSPAPSSTAPEQTGFRGITFLDPKDIVVEESQLSGLIVTVDGQTYDGVRASLALPITDSGKYVSLRLGTTKGEEIEIGMIRDTKDLDEQQQRLIRRELKKRYFIHVIDKLHSVKEKFGFIYYDADTDKGRRKFAMRYEYSRVQEYSEFGRVILDTDDNRYIIPDMRLLSADEHKAFTRYVYW